jgi:Ni,Fe-hydrogenase III small subunit
MDFLPWIIKILSVHKKVIHWIIHTMGYYSGVADPISLGHLWGLPFSLARWRQSPTMIKRDWVTGDCTHNMALKICYIYNTAPYILWHIMVRGYYGTADIMRHIYRTWNNYYVLSGSVNVLSANICNICCPRIPPITLYNTYSYDAVSMIYHKGRMCAGRACTGRYILGNAYRKFAY